MMDRHVNPLIAAESKPAAPHNGEHRPASRPVRTVRDAVAERVAQHNASVTPPRRVSLQSGLVAAERSLVASVGRPSDQRSYLALLALDRLLTLAASGPRAGAPRPENVDLLPVGHPLSTAPHAMTASAALHARAQWLAADPRLDDDARALVASAHAALPGSVERAYHFSQLAATDNIPTDLRLDAAPALLASLSWMGNSSAAKSARARAQRRDRLKRFAFQGGLFKFSGFDAETGVYSNIFGRVVAEPADSESFELEVHNHPILGTGIITVPSDKTEAIRAIGVGKDILNVNADGNPMAKVPTAKAAARGLDMQAMLASKKDAPTGWTRQKGAKNPTWTSDDGYTATRRTGPDGQAQYTLSRNAGGKLSKVGTGETWYDVQNLAETDSDAYEQSVKARLSEPAPDRTIGQDARVQAEKRGETVTGRRLMTRDELDQRDAAPAADPVAEARKGAGLEKYDTPDGQMAQAVRDGDPAELSRLLNESAAYRQDMEATMSKNKNKPGFDAAKEDLKKVTAARNATQANKAEKEKAAPSSEAGAQMIQAAKLEPGDRLDVDGKEQTVVSVSQPYTKKVGATDLKQTKSGKKKQVDITFEDADGKKSTKSWWPTTEVQVTRPSKPTATPRAPQDDGRDTVSRSVSGRPEPRDLAPDRTIGQDARVQAEKRGETVTGRRLMTRDELDQRDAKTKDAVADFAENVAVFEPAELTPQDRANGAVRKWTREDFREDGFGAIAEVSVSELEDGSFVSVREEYGTDKVTRQTYDAADYEKAFTGEAPTEKTKAPSTAKTAKEYAAEQGVNLDLLDKAVSRYFELNEGWSPAWAQSDAPITDLLTRSLAGDKSARDALLSIGDMTGEAYDFDGLSKKDKKQMLDASQALSDLFDSLPELEAKPPVEKAPTPAPAPTALEIPSFSSWGTGGMYELRNDQPYEPKGRTTQDSPDYTDDPEQLATMFDTTTLVNELERAVSSPGNGMTFLEFQAGREDVPAEAVYEALKKMGVDADRVVATVYDIMSGGGSDNAKALTAFRKANNIPDNPGEINGVPMVDGSVANAITLTGKLGNQQAAGIAAGLIDRYRAEGVQNPKIQEVADFLKKQDKFGSARALTEFFAFSESDDPQEQEAFRGLLGLLLVSDGGTDMIIKQLDNAAAFSGEDLTKDATKAVEKYGRFADLMRSKARVARGEEDPDSPDSTAGAMYRLAAAMAEPTTEQTYRGMSLEAGSQALREHTTVGQVLNLDVRPTSSGLENSMDYAGIYVPDSNEESVLMVFPAGEMDGIDVRKISPILFEEEILGVGQYVVDNVDTTVLENGVVLHTVTVRRYSEPAAVAKTETPNATFEMPEGAYTLDTSPADTTDLPPLLQPSELAKDFSQDVLTDQLVGAIEDGTGQGRLRLKDGSEQTVAAEVLRDALKAQGVDTNALIEGVLPDLEAFLDDKKGKEASLAKYKSDAADELSDEVIALSAEIDDFIARAEDYDLPENGEELLDELRSTLDGVNDLINNAVYEFDRGRIEDGNSELMKAGETLDEMYNRQGMGELGQTDQQVKGLMDKIDALIRETETPRGEKSAIAVDKPDDKAAGQAELNQRKTTRAFGVQEKLKDVRGNVTYTLENAEALGLDQRNIDTLNEMQDVLLSVDQLVDNAVFQYGRGNGALGDKELTEARSRLGDLASSEDMSELAKEDLKSAMDEIDNLLFDVGSGDGGGDKPPVPPTGLGGPGDDDGKYSREVLNFYKLGNSEPMRDELIMFSTELDIVMSKAEEYKLTEDDLKLLADARGVVDQASDLIGNAVNEFKDGKIEEGNAELEKAFDLLNDLRDREGLDEFNSLDGWLRSFNGKLLSVLAEDGSGRSDEPQYVPDQDAIRSLLENDIRVWSDLDGDKDISPRTQQNIDDINTMLDNVKNDGDMGNEPYDAGTLMTVKSALARLRAALFDDDGLDSARVKDLVKELDDEIELIEDEIRKSAVNQIPQTPDAGESQSESASSDIRTVLENEISVLKELEDDGDISPRTQANVDDLKKLLSDIQGDAEMGNDAYNASNLGTVRSALARLRVAILDDDGLDEIRTKGLVEEINDTIKLIDKAVRERMAGMSDEPSFTPVEPTTSLVTPKVPSETPDPGILNVPDEGKPSNEQVLPGEHWIGGPGALVVPGKPGSPVAYLDYAPKEENPEVPLTQFWSPNVRAYDANGNVIGFIQWDYMTGEIYNIWVDEKHRKKGVGTQLANRANEIAVNNLDNISDPGYSPETPLVHSDIITPRGKAWAESFEKQRSDEKAAPAAPEPQGTADSYAKNLADADYNFDTDGYYKSPDGRLEIDNTGDLTQVRYDGELVGEFEKTSEGADGEMYPIDDNLMSERVIDALDEHLKNKTAPAAPEVSEETALRDDLADMIGEVAELDGAPDLSGVPTSDEADDLMRQVDAETDNLLELLGDTEYPSWYITARERLSDLADLYSKLADQVEADSETDDPTISKKVGELRDYAKKLRSGKKTSAPAAPEEFIYTGKKAEPATPAQQQLVKDLLANDQVPQDVRDRVQADLDAKGADLNKGQIGVHIAELRDYPGSTTPTNRQLNSVKRELVARGVDEETAQALRDRLETMTRDEVSKEIKKLKAMPDVAGDTAKERGFTETTSDLDREAGVRMWQRESTGENGEILAEEVTLDNDGYHLATSYLDPKGGDQLGSYFDSKGDRVDDAFIDRAPGAAAKRAADAAPREWTDAVDRFGQVYGNELTDPESGFTAYVFDGQFFEAVVIDDRGNEVSREQLYRGQGETLDSAKAAAAAALDNAAKQALDARTADPAGFAQGRALEDLNILADMAGELRGVAVEGGVWDKMTKAARQAIADLGEPEVLNSDVPGVLDRFVAGTASADDVKAVSDFVQQKMDVLEKQAGPLHSVMLPKVRQFMESLGKVTPLGNEPFTTVATDKTPGDTTLPDGADLSGLKRVGEQAGSNEGGTYEDADGNQYYVKTAKSQAHADSEVLASKLYQAAGVDIVDVRKGTMDGKLVTFSPIVGESGESFYKKLQSDPEFKQKVQEGFIVDAWLSNWDVAGLNFDNVIVDEAGNPVRVDTGGALEWRAQGQPKTSVGVDFFDSSFDASTLRDPAVNAQSAKVFGDMSDEQLDASARRLFNISEMDINRLVDEVMGETRSAEDRDKMKFALKIRRKELIEAYVDYPAFTEPEEYSYNPDGGLKETTPQELKDAIEATFDPSEVQVNIDTNWSNPRYEAESQMGVTIHPGPDVTEKKWEEIKQRIDSMYDREDSYFDALDREPGTAPGNGLLDKVRLEGGLTVKPLNNEAPTEGIVVAVQGHNLEIPQADFFDPEKGPEAIAKWLKEKAAVFDKNGAYHIGMWYDKKNQEVVLDVVEVFTPEQREEAIQAGRDRNQQAIWDLGAFEEIPTGGTGDRAEQPTTGPADSAGDTAEGSGVDDRGGATGLGKDDSQPGSGADQAGVTVPKLTGYAIEQRPDGVHYPVTPLSQKDLRDLRDGKVAPPLLPFVVRDTDSGDVHYYDSTGVRRWGQFGAAGTLLTRTGQDGNDEFLLVQRANTLSTEPAKWTVPGGAHKSKADAAEPNLTAETELREETGVILDNNGLRKEVRVQPAPDWSFDYTVAPVADDFDPAQLDLDPLELQSAEWFSAEDIRDLLNEGKLHSAIDSDTVEKLIEAGSTPFDFKPELVYGDVSQPATSDFGSRATYKKNDRVEVSYDPDDEGIGYGRTGTVVGLVPGSMNEYVIRVDDNPDNGSDAGRLIEAMPDDMRPDVSEPAKPTVVENEPQAAPAAPSSAPSESGAPLSESDDSMPDIEPDMAEIAPGDILSMQKIKDTWPDHTMLENGDIVVDEITTTRDGRPVTRQIVIRRNATSGSNSGKNETYTVYARETDVETGEVRVLERKNRSHSNKALGNQVAKMRELLDGSDVDGQFKKTKVDPKAPKAKVLKSVDDPDVKAMIDDATAKAPGRSEDANLGALIQIAGQLSDTPENREALADAMKNWGGYFGSGEAVRAVFDAVQAGDGDKLGQMRKVTHLSKNGVEIQKDMRVSWTSPDGEKTRTGTVVKRATGLDSKGYGFTDYVYVRFDDNKGKYVHRVSDRLEVLDRDDNPLASPDGAQGAPSGEAKDLPTQTVDAASQASPDAAARGAAIRSELSTRPYTAPAKQASAQEVLDDIVAAAGNNGRTAAEVEDELQNLNSQLPVPNSSVEAYLNDRAYHADLSQPKSYAHLVSADLKRPTLGPDGKPNLTAYGPDAFERIDTEKTPTDLQVGDIYQTMGGMWVQVTALGSTDSNGAAITKLAEIVGPTGSTFEYNTRSMSKLSYGTLLRPNDATMGGDYTKSTSSNEAPVDQLEGSGGGTMTHVQSVLALTQTAMDPGLLRRYNADNQEGFLDTLSKFYPQDAGLGNRLYPIYPGAVVYRSDGTIGVVQSVKAKDFSDWESEMATEADVAWISGPAAGKKETLPPSVLTAARGATALGTELPALLGIDLQDEEVAGILKEELITKPAEIKKKLAAAQRAEAEALRDLGLEPGPGVELPPTDPSARDYSQSPVGGVSSLTAALDTVNRGDYGGRDGLNGVPVLLDAGDIEDGQVILHAIENADGEHQVMVRLTLTSWAGDQLVSRLIDERSQPDGRGLPGPTLEVNKYEMRDLDGSGDPYLVAVGDWSGYSVDNIDAGRTYIEPIKDANGVTIGEARLHRATDDATNPSFLQNSGGPLAFHNKLELVLWKNDATPEEIASALEQFGVKDPGPATPEALKVIKENKMISLLDNKHNGAINYVGESRATVLADIERDWGLKADDIEIKVVPGSGHVQFIAPREFGEKMAKTTGAQFLTHTGRIAGPPGETRLPNVKEQADQVIAMLEGDNTLVATAERWSAGKNYSGMSSESDVKNQGGNYLFFYPHTGNDEPEYALSDSDSFMFRLTLDAPEVLRRLDWFYNQSDQYGRRQTSSPIDLLTSYIGAGTDELMVKHAVDIPAAVHSIDFIHQDAAQRVIDWYNTNRGGVLPDGRPITDLFPTKVAGVATETEETTL